MRFYHIARPSSRGRPPKLRYHHQALGLILCFYVGSMENGTLCMLFGVPPSTLSRTLRKAEEALSRSLDGYARSPNCMAVIAAGAFNLFFFTIACIQQVTCAKPMLLSLSIV
ncbi:hypothetical protein GQ600_18239 [Phytophthora cactorum]|nr:hypothetical protein GQ600_18239 [Phytophthora cactorum]